MTQRFAVPLLVLAVLGAAAAVALVVASGDDDEPALVLRPTATAAVVPLATQPTPTLPVFPAPTPSDLMQPASPFAVFVRGDGLWIAPLDGSLPPQQATAGGFPAQYAGFAQAGGGEIELFYVQQLAAYDASASRQTPAALYGLSLGGGVAREIRRFYTSRLSPTGSSAAVSPDGAYALLAEGSGMTLIDLTTHHARALFTNSSSDCGPQTCLRYRLPRWSPDGSRAIITEVYWEGGQDFIIDPFAETVDASLEPGEISTRGRWDSDDGRICGRELSYVDTGAVLVHDLATGETVDATLGVTIPTPTRPVTQRIATRDCAWSPSGELAFGFNAPDNLIDGAIAVVDSSNRLLHQSEPIPNLSRVVTWLRDGSGVVYNRWHAQGGGVRPPGIYYFEAGLVEFPFEADAVLAVIP